MVEDGNKVLTMPVVVGRKDRRTPVLATQITGMIFNPSGPCLPRCYAKTSCPR